MTLVSRIPAIVAALEGAERAVEVAGAELVARNARERAPVRSGRLRDAIHVETNQDGAYVVAGNNDAWYGHIVEHGAAHSPPQPFLVPAFEESRSAIRAASAVSIALAAR